MDDLAKTFNTALLATRITDLDVTAEIAELVRAPAFRAILASIRQLARTHNLSERQAAEQVVQTFRRIDSAWGEYVFREGVNRLRG